MGFSEEDSRGSVLDPTWVFVHFANELIQAFSVIRFFSHTHKNFKATQLTKLLKMPEDQKKISWELSELHSRNRKGGREDEDGVLGINFGGSFEPLDLGEVVLGFERNCYGHSKFCYLLSR